MATPKDLYDDVGIVLVCSVFSISIRYSPSTLLLCLVALFLLSQLLLVVDNEGSITVRVDI